MTENREPDPHPSDPQPPNPQRPDPQPAGPQPPDDDIRWLIYLAVGLVVFLALVVRSGLHSAMGH